MAGMKSGPEGLVPNTMRQGGKHSCSEGWTTAISNDRYEELIRRLNLSLRKSNIITDKARVIAYGTSAGFYRLPPRLVVRVDSESEVREVLAACNQLGISITFRGSGTSLSGQAISDSVLVFVGDAWKTSEVANDGASITLGIKVTGGEANEALQPYRRKIGPDPASIQAATIAGIVANNSSGMTCGTAFNAWNTITGIRLVLADGTILDTRDERSRQNFLKTHADFVKKLLEIARRARENPEVRERILKKYGIKNTTGYSVNSLVAFEDPFDIIMHLMVGSEGTLAFMSEITLKTIEDPAMKATSLMAFEDVDAACRALLILKEHQVAAAEFMDRRTIAAVEDLPGVPGFLRELGPKAVTLLVETRSQSREVLEGQVRAINEALVGIPTVVPIVFAFDEAECQRLWEIRNGFGAIVKANAPRGTTIVGEDIAIPLEHLEPALNDFYQLFERWGYGESVVYGHALSGNLHYALILDFNSAEQVRRFKGLIKDLPTIVVDKYDGSLKAEHGTGRFMAPFVEREWGKTIFDIMKEVKTLFDPAGILNRGVILTDDPEAHLSFFKDYPLIDKAIDACIECGFCERVCVSHELTLSARQRIALIRQLYLLEKTGENPELLKELEKEAPYLLMDTCAACERCETACPSGINTGKYIKKLKGDRLNFVCKYIAGKIADHVDMTTAIARAGLSFALGTTAVLSETLVKACVDRLRNFPRPDSKRWLSHLPRPTRALCFENGLVPAGSCPEVVYFPSCIDRMMGVDPKIPGQKELVLLIRKLCNRAGYRVRFPQYTANLCCGLAFASKGYRDAAQACERKLAGALLDVSNGGELPILTDMSSCLLHMKQTQPKILKLYEPVEFTMTYLAPRLKFKKLKETVVVHPVCSARNMGLEKMMVELAGLCAEKVVSTRTNCCGFAGDKGFTHPELNRHGLRHLAEQLVHGTKRGFSTNRTCEIGLSEESGIPFMSILYLVEEATEPLGPPWPEMEQSGRRMLSPTLERQKHGFHAAGT